MKNPMPEYQIKFLPLTFVPYRNHYWIKLPNRYLGGPFPTIDACLYYLFGLTQATFNYDRFDQLRDALFDPDLSLVLGLIESENASEILLEIESTVGASLTEVTDFFEKPWHTTTQIKETLGS